AIGCGAPLRDPVGERCRHRSSGLPGRCSSTSPAHGYASGADTCRATGNATESCRNLPLGARGSSAVACWLLALCNMRTLYLRNVPDDVVRRLERLAARDGTSVGAVAVRELADVTRRADNPALLGLLPDLNA